MEHSKHIWRALLLLCLVGVAAILVRHFLMPPSFGVHGAYRYDSLAEFMSLPVQHGGSAACGECHEDEHGEVSGGKHRSVQCEVCHAPLATHVRQAEKIGDMRVNRSHGLCAYCHRKVRARPPTVPQIVIAEHLVTNKALAPGAPIPDGICLSCHEAHGPSTE